MLHCDTLVREKLNLGVRGVVMILENCTVEYVFCGVCVPKYCKTHTPISAVTAVNKKKTKMTCHGIKKYVII